MLALPVEAPALDLRPGHPRRFAHAVPRGTRITLCGRVVREDAPPSTGAPMCPRCTDTAQRKSFIAR